MMRSRGSQEPLYRGLPQFGYDIKLSITAVSRCKARPPSSSRDQLTTFTSSQQSRLHIKAPTAPSTPDRHPHPEAYSQLAISTPDLPSWRRIAKRQRVQLPITLNSVLRNHKLAPSVKLQAESTQKTVEEAARAQWRLPCPTRVELRWTAPAPTSRTANTTESTSNPLSATRSSRSSKTIRPTRSPSPSPSPKTAYPPHHPPHLPQNPPPKPSCHRSRPRHLKNTKPPPRDSARSYSRATSRRRKRARWAIRLTRGRALRRRRRVTLS